MSGAGTGALLGLTAAAGLVYAGVRSPLLRRVRMEDRVAPYLRDMPRQSRLLGGRAGVGVGGAGRLRAPVAV